jgi:ankyrin repeat protein
VLPCQDLFDAISSKDASLVADLLTTKYTDGSALDSMFNYAFCNPLHHAAETNDVDIVDALIEHGMDVTTMTGDMESTLLHVAVESHSHQVLEHLLQHDYIGDSCYNSDGMSAYDLAVFTNDLSSVKIFHKHRQMLTAHNNLYTDNDYNCMCDRPMEPLHVAAINGYLAMVKYFLEEVHIQPDITCNGRTPILQAIEYNHIEIVRYMLQNNIHCQIDIDTGEDPITLAVSNRNLEMLKLLVQHNVTVYPEEYSGGEGLFVEISNISQAIESQDFDIAEFLRSQGADVLKRDDHGLCAIDYAAEYGTTEFLADLLKRNMVDEEYTNKLLRAAARHQNGDNLILLYEEHNLREQYNDPDEEDCVLLEAALNDNVDAVKFLIARRYHPANMTPEIIMSHISSSCKVMRYLILHHNVEVINVANVISREIYHLIKDIKETRRKMLSSNFSDVGFVWRHGTKRPRKEEYTPNKAAKI